jgi:hypothetical protein
LRGYIQSQDNGAVWVAALASVTLDVMIGTRGVGAAVSGRGLGFVEELATRWGHHGNRDGRVVWFEVDWQ